jgi:hypothetical protein
MTILIVVVAVVLVLALWFELRELRRPRSSGSRPEGPDEMRQHIEHDAELGHSWRSGYRRSH